MDYLVSMKICLITTFVTLCMWPDAKSCKSWMNHFPIKLNLKLENIMRTAEKSIKKLARLESLVTKYWKWRNIALRSSQILYQCISREKATYSKSPFTLATFAAIFGAISPFDRCERAITYECSNVWEFLLEHL